MKGIFYDPFRARRKSYRRFKCHLQEDGNTFLAAKADTNAQKKVDKQFPRLDKEDREKVLEKERKKAERDLRNDMQRMHGAGLAHGLFPNPREWWERFRSRARKTEDFKEVRFSSLPSSVKWFPGDLRSSLAHRVLRAKSKIHPEKAQKYQRVFDAVDKLEAQVRSLILLRFTAY